MDKDLTLDELKVMWEMLHRQISDCSEAIAKIFTPLLKEVINQLAILIIWVRREQLYWSLTKWRVPEQPARWVADKWPERWLPELRFE